MGDPVSFLLMAAVSAFGADVTGTWEGEMTMPKQDSPYGGAPGGSMGSIGPMKYTFNLKAEGDKLSG